MATPGSVWATLANQMLNAREGFRQGRERIDLEKQQEQRLKQESIQRQRMFDQKFFDDMMSRGALPSISGMVKQTMYDPGNPELGVGPTNGTLLRPADRARLRKYKTAEGDTVEFEIPTEEDQRNRHFYEQLMSTLHPARRQVTRIQNQEKEDAESGLSASRAFGSASGVTAGKQADLEARGVVVSDELADAVGIPRGTKVTPEERDALSQRYVSVRGSNDRQQKRLDAKASGVKSTHVTVGPGGKQTLLTVYNNGETEEAPMEATSVVKPTAAGGLTPAQAGVQNRFNQRLQEMASKKHDDLQAKEQQAWDLKGAIGDALNTQDGETFVDPTSKNGKEIKMNPAQRKVFQNRYKAAEKTAQQLQAEAKKIRQKYGWGEFERDAAASDRVPAAGRGRASRSAPATSKAGKVATRAQLQGYAQKFGMTEQQAMKAFQDQGYEVK